MQLIYLWINDGRTLFEKEDLNFWSKYKFTTHIREEKAYIKYQKSANYIEGFWNTNNSDKIVEVTGIVGRNGSGKTSLVSFIRDNISHDIGNSNLRYICIFKIHGRDHYTVYNSTGLKINFTNENGKKSENLSFELTERGRLEKDLISLKYPTSFFHYSPLLNINLNNFHFPIDLSTTHMISELGSYKNNLKSFHEFQCKEVIDQLNFIVNNTKVVNFDLPNECRFYLVRKEYDSLSKYLTFGESNHLLSYFRKMMDSYRVIEKKEENEQLMFSVNFWYYIQFMLLEKYFVDKKDLSIKLNEGVYDHDPLNFLRAILNNVLVLCEYTKTDIKDFLFTGNIAAPVISKNKYHSYVYDNFFDIQINKGTIPYLKKMIGWIKKSDILSSIFTISWEGLSTGETTYLNLFSRFYNSKDEQKAWFNHIDSCRTEVHNLPSIKSIDDAVIFIDEGETGLHPQWQKDYIKNIVNELPKLISFKRIQIVFTTNNPIVLSDIPIANCIYLERKGAKTKVKKAVKQSFGGNIVDLFRENFFVEGGLIGGFAKEKLNHLAHKLLNENYNFSDDEITDAKKLLNIIGDEIIGARFKSLLEERSQR